MGIWVICNRWFACGLFFLKILNHDEPPWLSSCLQAVAQPSTSCGVLKKYVLYNPFQSENIPGQSQDPRPSKWQSFQSDLQVFVGLLNGSHFNQILQVLLPSSIISSFPNPGEMGIYCSSPSAIKRGNGKSPTSTEVCNWWWIFQQRSWWHRRVQ